ncbi:HNH endonuclease [Paenibacillus polymyxa]|nr:HNH endonuclease [Paenibacillus polymyxa]
MDGERGIRPSVRDFIYLLQKINSYQEAKWLVGEFSRLGKKTTKRMLEQMTYFAFSVDECLDLHKKLEGFKVKHFRKVRPEAAFSRLYIQLIIVSENRKQAEYFFQEARGKGIFLGKGHLDNAGDKDSAYLILQKWKKLCEVIKPDFNMEARLANISTEHLYQLSKRALHISRVRGVTFDVFTRNLYVALLAKRLASGKCQLCLEDAPFTDKDGVPYLEAHHIQWLSRCGEDTIENTIALCPNCHKKIHILDLQNDIQFLTKRNMYLMSQLVTK